MHLFNPTKFFTLVIHEDNPNWTPFPDDNLLGLTDKNSINEIEAKGLAMAELYVFELDTETSISTILILEIHKIAFAQLYDWEEKWRTTQVVVGQFQPPQSQQVVQAMYQFIDNPNYKISIAKTRYEHVNCLAFTHYEFI